MKRILYCLAGLVHVALISGCASTGNTAGADVVRNDAEWVTESDEPETRKRARIRVQLAAGYFERGQTTVALDEVKQALKIDPSYAPAHNLHGLIYMRLNELRLAEAGFQRALELTPHDAGILHNLGWLYCQEAKYEAAISAFTRALREPNYVEQAKTWMTQGICQARAGDLEQAERSLARSFELDAGNPITTYNLAALLFQRGAAVKAQFYIRRLNNSEGSNAETLWLGIKIEQHLNNRETVRQLGDQLRRRYPDSREFKAFERGAFNE